jgi:hypothetical protein
MSWNLSVTGTKLEIEQKLEEEVNKYEAVDFYNGALKTIWPFIEANIESIDDRAVITVKSTGGYDVVNNGTFTHTVSVITGQI